MALHEKALAIGQQAQRRILPGLFLPVQSGTVAHGTDAARLHGLGQTVQRGRKGVVVDMALAQPTADTAWRQALCVRQPGGRLIRAVTHDAVHVVRQTKKAYRYPVRLSCFVRPRGCGYFIS